MPPNLDKSAGYLLESTHVRQSIEANLETTLKESEEPEHYVTGLYPANVRVDHHGNI